jgi:hypothetical protein
MPSIGYDAARELTERLESRLVDRLEGSVSRRAVLGGAGTLGAAALGAGSAGANGDHDGEAGHGGERHGTFGSVEEYGDGFDPHAFLRTFNTGFGGQDDVAQEVLEEDGERVRSFELYAVDDELEIAPGVTFPVWAFQGQVPGPTLRVTEGDLVRVTFTNGSSHAHTIHPHLRNPDPAMDGIPRNGPGVLEQGESFTCDRCGEVAHMNLAALLFSHPAAVAFYHNHGIDLRSTPTWEIDRRSDRSVELLDDDPLRARVAVAIDDERLVATVAADASIESVERDPEFHPEPG